MKEHFPLYIPLDLQYTMIAIITTSIFDMKTNTHTSECEQIFFIAIYGLLFIIIKGRQRHIYINS